MSFKMKGRFHFTWNCRLLSGSVGEMLPVLLVALMAFSLWPSAAAAWWNDEWSLRKKITIDSSPTGANVTDPIGTMPVLIRLHLGNFRFGQAKDDGSDLRFLTADEKTPLKYHFEKYDSLLGEALVWVNVPDVKPGSKVSFWLYYGNKKANAIGDEKGTYDPDTQLVYHFSERGTPPRDSSPWANHAQNAGQAVEGAIIGSGLHLNGTTTVALPGSPSLAIQEGGALTWSAWVKPASLQRNATIYSRRDGTNGISVGLDDGVPYFEITSNGSVQRSAAGLPVAPNGWHYLAVTATPGLVTVFLDGNAYATLKATLPPLNSIALLGGDAAAAPMAGDQNPGADATLAAAPISSLGFAGDIDELQISNVARTAGFIKAAFTNQGSEHEKFVTYENEEETASWFSGGYFVVILKSVTLDGWTVISLLFLMAVVSWVVMVQKALLINRQYKANTLFKLYFRQFGSDLTMLKRGDEAEVASLAGRLTAGNYSVARDSSLYRIYRLGADEIRSRFSHAEARLVLSAQSIAAVRAVLDGGFIAETQQLNRLMVLLTIAISGGPFLGLLGTVMGVMITFAAIAVSGDVNVNAIAPGIAAALVATVAGLGVAIPALFGYNYLVTRIKDLSVDMQIFVDQFVTKIAEHYDSVPTQQSQSLAAE